MSKSIPLKCNVCGNVVGSVKVIEPTDPASLVTDGEMVLEQHKEDCPVLEMLANPNNTLMSISIGSYSGSIVGENAEANLVVPPEVSTQE